ncbi:MAG: DUF11 domain-containing protein [Caldilineae bacterium]|nr:MAG: DUF11 domain-containing protein [Caldilineae bacterium]
MMTYLKRVAVLTFAALFLTVALFAAMEHAATPALAAPITGISYKIKIYDSGLYRVTYSDLTAAGFNPAGIDTSTFQLFTEGVEVPIFLFDGGDDAFDPGDYFVFYGEQRQTRYTDYNYYWFVAGEASRLLPTTVDGTPAGAPAAQDFEHTLHFEGNELYESALPLTGDDVDRWYWKYFCAVGRPCRTRSSYSFSADLPAVSSIPHTATITVVLRGAGNLAANPDHAVQVSINGTSIATGTFEGYNLYQGSFGFASGVITSGTNTVRMDFPPYPDASGANEGYIQYYEITYRSSFTAVNDALAFAGDDPGVRTFQVGGFTDSNILVLNIDDPKHPVQITGGQVAPGGSYDLTFQADNGAGGAQYYAASAAGFLSPASVTQDTPSNLKDTANGADYIIISHADFITYSQQLADYRAASRGFRTAVIDVQDIYDEFNNGLMHPEAIRNFLIYATHNWQPPRPRYVVLMGDGHYDPLGYLPSTTENVYIPPWIAAVDPFQGETAADNRYVDILGDEQYDSDGDTNNIAHLVEVQNGNMVMSVDFGYHSVIAAQQASALAPAAAPDAPALVKAFGDMVFWDEDLDGIWDADERGIPGVTVNLWSNGSIVQVQVTDGEGNYSFEDIPTGVYTIEVIPPAGFSPTLKDVGGDDRYDSDIDPVTYATDPLTYTYGNPPNDDVDAGFARPGTIGDRVWLDLDADGLQDSGEPGIAGVQLNLRQGGNLITSTTTGPDGIYTFLDVPDGVYEVEVDPSNFSGVLAGLVISPRDQGFDLMPDLSLGRFPVNTQAEAAEMVNRAINYETNSPPGDWQKRVIFVADEPDVAGNFYDHSNQVADYIWPYPADSLKLYHQLNGLTAAQVNAQLKAGIDGTLTGPGEDRYDGALFVTYNGHSSVPWWGSEQYFKASDIPTLNNSIFPIFLPMTCLEGQYLNPNGNSVGEAAVRTIGRGAVATFSPTGLGVAHGHQYLYNRFFEALVGGESTEIGPLTVLAKQALFESHSLYKDLLDTYVLFGDPALQVQLPSPDPAIVKTVEPNASVSPGDTITYTLSYSNTGVITASNVIITDILPAGLLNPTVTSTPPLTPDPGTTFQWTLGDLAPAAGGWITVVAQVDPALATPATITNTAIITTSGNDRNPDNNRSSTTTPVGAPITLGGITWYDMNNNGNIDANETNRVAGVQITATLLGPNTHYITYSNLSGVWLLPDLPAGSYEISAGDTVGAALTTPRTQYRTLTGGQSDTQINFGYIVPTAVELASFAAVPAPEGVLLTWQTTSEVRVSGFRLYRSIDAADHGKAISELIPAEGGAAGATYRYLDTGVRGGGWYYWLQAQHVDGSAEFFGPLAVQPPPDEGFSRKLYLGFIVR